MQPIFRITADRPWGLDSQALGTRPSETPGRLARAISAPRSLPCKSHVRVGCWGCGVAVAFSTW
eukprot:3469141-Pyramimonas_sp.AAC.1